MVYGKPPQFNFGHVKFEMLEKFLSGCAKLAVRYTGLESERGLGWRCNSLWLVVIILSHETG